jgi:isoleucyl-tRNA synthetase
MTPTEQADYKNTLNLPQTDFPMQAKLPEREPERLKRWQAEDLAGQMTRNRAGRPIFCLHDGPPYANGDIHMGHALNKILKDVIVRYKTLQGFRSVYIPGWDCHGLPIEQKVLQNLGDKMKTMAPIEIRRRCHQYALKWVAKQSEQFQRLGITGDWARPYLSIDPKVEAGILSAFRDLVAKGLVRKGFRPVYWDPFFQTALAEAEIEYENHKTDSIYVKFPLLNSETVPGLAGLANVSIVIWTTTPWTLPANLAVCLHPDFEYVVIRHGDEHYIVADSLAEAFKKECKLPEDLPVVARVKARDLERRECKHPIFKDKTSLVVLGAHVTAEQGTGCVHTAPGHGADDFAIGKAYGLPVFVPVDGAGCFTSDFPDMQGVNVFDANPKIVKRLEDDGLLLGHVKIEHQYPFSWRSHQPIIFRATEQWFMELDHPENNVRAKALEAIATQVQWIPAWGQERIHNMVAGRPDWCLSRQRSWGVPIPSIRSKTEKKSILCLPLIEKFVEIVRAEGTNAWFTEPLERFWPEGWTYAPTGENTPDQFEKEFEVLDVWFDAGATHIAVLEQRLDEGLAWPASLYLEGSDQHRGWFQLSLLVAIGARGRAPYEAVLTHGWVLDGKGEAMSKSKGNVIAPSEVVDKMGADVLRLWVVSEDYRADLTLSQDILKRIAEAYRRIRNTFKFLIGNLYDFDPARDAVAPAAMDEHDRWVLRELNLLIQAVTQAYETYQFHRVFQLAHTFCSITLSALYLDVVKDRLYCSGANDPTRRSAQTACHHILDALLKMLAPILAFTTDEAWETAGLGPEKSVHLASFPAARDDWEAPELAEPWAKLLDLRAEAGKALEEKRRAKEIGHSLDAAVTIWARDAEDEGFLRKYVALLKKLVIVSRIQIEPPQGGAAMATWRIEAGKAPGVKCERCWMHDPQVGEDARHQGLCPRCADVVKRMG